MFSLDVTLGVAPAQREASHWVCRPQPPGRGAAAGQVEFQPMPCPGPPGMNHKMIHRCLQLTLNLDAQWEVLSCESRLVDTSSSLVAVQQEVQDMPRPDAIYLGFVWEKEAP